MKITVTPSTGPAVTLCDHGRESAAGFVVTPIRKVEVLAFVQAEFSKPRNRGNTLRQMTFSMTKSHADYTTAQIYLMDRDAQVPAEGTVRVEFDDQYNYLEAENATVELSALPILGVKTTINYIIKYGAYTLASSTPLSDPEEARIVTSDGQTIITSDQQAPTVTED